MKLRLCLLSVCIVLAGCGSGSSTLQPTIQAAHVFRLANFEPAGKVPLGKPVKVAFTIEQPDGKQGPNR